MKAQAPLNPLPGVPLIDSPFFERLFPLTHPDALEQRIARDLRENGFAIFDFPDDIERLSREIIARQAPSIERLEAWRAGHGELRNSDAWRTDPNVRNVATNAKLLALLEKLYGRPAFPFHTLNFPVGSQQAPHSDSTHFDSSPGGFMCGLWLALEDIDLDNGPLIYYPGSHLWPHYNNDHIGVNAWHQPTPGAHAPEHQKVWDALVALHQARPERFTAKKGQAIIWHARLMHGGDKQLDKLRSRHSQVTHYFFRDCAYFTPLYSDPFYGNIYFRDVTDIGTGEPVPNMVSGHAVPRWFLSQAKHHGPLNAIKNELSRLKRRVLGQQLH